MSLFAASDAGAAVSQSLNARLLSALTGCGSSGDAAGDLKPICDASADLDGFSADIGQCGEYIRDFHNLPAGAVRLRVEANARNAVVV